MLEKENKREQVSKKVRFEVFKRDNFCCQYCGRSAPSVVLQVDHINPVSKGGANDILNLVTSCWECNIGKSNNLLSDSQVVTKQMEELAIINERREQLEMIKWWRDELLKVNDEYVDYILSILCCEYSTDPTSINRTIVLKWVKKFPIDEIITTIEDCANKNVSLPVLFENLPRYIGFKKLPQDEQRIFYCRGILKNRLNYFDPHRGIILLKEAQKAGIPIDKIEDFCKNVSTWTNFVQGIEYGIEKYSKTTQ